MAKTVTILGSTGSIGTQSLDVVRMQGYTVYGLAANRSVELLLRQVADSCNIIKSNPRTLTHDEIYEILCACM